MSLLLAVNQRTFSSYYFWVSLLLVCVCDSNNGRSTISVVLFQFKCSNGFLFTSRMFDKYDGHEIGQNGNKLDPWRFRPCIRRVAIATLGKHWFDFVEWYPSHRLTPANQVNYRHHHMNAGSTCSDSCINLISNPDMFLSWGSQVDCTSHSWIAQRMAHGQWPICKVNYYEYSVSSCHLVF